MTVTHERLHLSLEACQSRSVIKFDLLRRRFGRSILRDLHDFADIPSGRHDCSNESGEMSVSFAGSVAVVTFSQLIKRLLVEEIFIVKC